MTVGAFENAEWVPSRTAWPDSSGGKNLEAWRSREARGAEPPEMNHPIPPGRLSTLKDDLPLWCYALGATLER